MHYNDFIEADDNFKNILIECGSDEYKLFTSFCEYHEKCNSRELFLFQQNISSNLRYSVERVAIQQITAYTKYLTKYNVKIKNTDITCFAKPLSDLSNDYFHINKLDIDNINSDLFLLFNIFFSEKYLFIKNEFQFKETVNIIKQNLDSIFKYEDYAVVNHFLSHEGLSKFLSQHYPEWINSINIPEIPNVKKTLLVNKVDKF